MRDFISCAKAISDGTRIRILKLLGRGELCVCQLMEILAMGQSTVSKHLGILRSAGLVSSRREGTWTFYRLEERAVGKSNLDFLRFIGMALEEDERIREDRDRARAVLKRPLSSLCSIRAVERRG